MKLLLKNLISSSNFVYSVAVEPGPSAANIGMKESFTSPNLIFIATNSTMNFANVLLVLASFQNGYHFPIFFYLYNITLLFRRKDS